jgi:hypothetical protein
VCVHAACCQHAGNKTVPNWTIHRPFYEFTVASSVSPTVSRALARSILDYSAYIAAYQREPFMLSNLEQPTYTPISATCRCGTKQNVHVLVRSISVTDGFETVQCVDCSEAFEAKVPDKIIRGPFRSN